ncbi:MAG TPA: hypothetical protein VF784_03020 [Anaerolineales bacterium]
METILDTLRDLGQAIRDINEKYKTPRIKTTPMVSASLLLLRLYLIGMLLLLLYKFITVVAVR